MGIMDATQLTLLISSAAKSFLFHCQIIAFIALRLALKICATHGHVQDARFRFVRNHEKRQCWVCMKRVLLLC